MNCPRCANSERVKNGVINSVQRYRCKGCKYNYTVEVRRNEYPKSMKKKALQLYLEGLGFRSIGRFLEVSNVTVLNWIRSFGQEIKSLHSESCKIEMVELDEMHSYIGNKKTIVGFGLLLIDLEKDSSASLLATEAVKQQKNFGKQSNSIK